MKRPTSLRLPQQTRSTAGVPDVTAGAPRKTKSLSGWHALARDRFPALVEPPSQSNDRTGE